MKKINISLFALIIGSMIPTMAFTQSYEIKSHEIIVSGTSNLHDWTANAEKASGTFKIDVADGKIKTAPSINLIVEANSLKGSKGNVMDSKIKDALNAKKNPYITFRSTSGNVVNQSGVHNLTSNGVLTVAGNQQNITVNAQGKILPNGDIEFTGSKKLKMTDYKVNPPKAMLGALTTGDDITLSFKIVLKSI